MNQNAIKIWEHVNANRNGAVFHGSAFSIEAATGISHWTVAKVLAEWSKAGWVENVVHGCRKIVSVPEFDGPRKHVSPVIEPKLREMSEAGDSLNEMAMVLKTTKSAIAGKRWRLGLPKRDVPVNLRKKGKDNAVR